MFSSLLTMSNATEITGGPEDREKTSAMSESSVLDILQTVVTCGLTISVSVVGSGGKVLTLAVLAHNGLKDTSNILLLSLSVCDLVFLVVLLLTNFSCIIGHFNPVAYQSYRPYSYTYLWGLGRLAINLSLCHIVIISLERFLAVFYPFHVSRWVTPRRILILLFVVYISMILLMFPWVFTYYTYSLYFDETFNRTFPFLTHTNFYIKNKFALDFYNSVIINTLTGPVCLVIVVTISCAIACKLYTISKRVSTISDNGVDLRVSRMLLTVCAIYILAITPSFFIYMYSYIRPDLRPGIQLYDFLRKVEECVMALNSTANFFIYILMSGKFSVSLRAIFHCPRKNSDSTLGLDLS